MRIKKGHGLHTFLPVLLLLAIVGSTGSSYALDVNGIIDSDSRWTISDSPIHVTGDLLVETGATLTIQAGVEVIFQPRPDTARGYNLTVEGTLVARGDTLRPIVFTAQNRDLPWGAIIFQDISQDWNASQSMGSVLSYCVVEYGGNYPDGRAMIVTVNAMPLIANNAIRFSSAAGIAAIAADGAASPSGDIQIVDNQIYSNPTGLLVAAEGGLVAGNYFLKNGRSVNLSTRSNDLDITGNTIIGESAELFGSGIFIEIDEPASGITDYRWKQTSGPAVVLNNPNSARPSFTAPDPGSNVYTLTFALTVTGSSGIQSTEAVDVTVIGTNEPPVANAGADSNAKLSDNPAVSVEVTLNGAGSFDPDLGISAYRWQQTSGKAVTLQNSNSVTPSFVVPSSVVAGEQMSFTLTVTDRGGLQSSDTVDVRFYQANIYPVASAGEDFSAVQGDTVALNGSGSRDPDGGITAYLWVQTGGTPVILFNVNTAKPFFTAPEVDGSGETLTFRLRVQDTGGLADVDDLSVQVNGATSADPGKDLTVLAGDPVILDGSGSVDVDDIASVAIEANVIQSDNADAGLVSISAIEGARYTLNLTGNNLFFTETAGYAIYLFDWPEPSVPLEMMGNWWGSTNPTIISEMIVDNKDDLNLPVVDYEPFATQAVAGAGSSLTYPPLADAGPDLETAVDLQVTLDGSNSYDPDGIGVYHWQQVDGPAVILKNSEGPIATFVAPSGGIDGTLVQLSLTIATGGAFSHTDTVDVTVNPDEPVPLVDAGGGCFIQSTTSRLDDMNEMDAMTIKIITGLLFGLGLLIFKKKCKTITMVCLVILSIFIVAEADAGFFAVGGGGGGDADQYNVTLETGAKDITVNKLDLLFAIGIPFIPHGDEDLPDNTIAFPCPNNDCESAGTIRKGTEVGFYGKLGFEIGSTNLYLNAIGGVSVYTESQLSRSRASGATYEDSSDTTIDPLYGGGLSYFTDNLSWPILIQVDYDNIRGVTGTIGWYW